MDETITTQTEQVETNTGAAAGTETTSTGTPAPSGATDYAALLDGVDISELLKQPGVATEVQRIADARVTQAIATAKTKWEAAAQEQQDEAAKLAKMTETEKAQYQLDKDRRAFEAEKASFDKQRLALQAAKTLTEAGLPDLSAYITGDTAEATAANIATVTQILTTWQSGQLQKAMGGTPPQDTSLGVKGTITREQLNTMSADEINKAWEDGLIDVSKL